MARTIAPGNPTPVQPVNVKIPDIDLSVFDEMGDKKIKLATQNFKLYATSAINAESQSAYQKFKNNPIALANAMSKLPDMLNDLPESIQAEFKPKIDANAISLITKAQANQQAQIAKQNKINANANVAYNMNQIADSYFNVLRYYDSPDEEKRELDLKVYQAYRQNLADLVNMTDENGNPLYNESLRQKMAMPKEAILAGLSQYINRMEKDQLTDWFEKKFQNRDQFVRDTLIDQDVYDSADTMIRKRIKQLADTSTVTTHGQAWYDQANLITQPTEVAIEKAKSWDFTDDKSIDTLAKTAKEITLSKYYNPTLQTSPADFLQAYNVYGQLLNNMPENLTPDNQGKLIKALASANQRLLGLAKEINLPPETADKIQETMRKALTDKVARQKLLDTNFGGKFIESTYTPMTDQSNTLFTTVFDTQQQKGIAELARGGQVQDSINKWNEVAVQNYNIELGQAILYYLNGDYDTFNRAVAQADRNFDKTRAGFIVRSDNEWARLENALAQGQPALVNYMGRIYEFKGFDNRGALFTERN